MLDVSFNITNDKQAAIMQAASLFYLNKLDIEGYTEYYNRLVVSDIDKYKLLSKQVNGYLRIQPDPKPTSTLYLCIDVNNKVYRPLEALAHEFIHVQQAVTGKLINKRKNFYWLNKMSLRYTNNAPWEKEAYGNQKKLYNCFINSRVK